jgi:hypothetical protein
VGRYIREDLLTCYPFGSTVLAVHEGEVARSNVKAIVVWVTTTSAVTLEDVERVLSEVVEPRAVARAVVWPEAGDSFVDVILRSLRGLGRSGEGLEGMMDVATGMAGERSGAEAKWIALREVFECLGWTDVGEIDAGEGKGRNGAEAGEKCRRCAEYADSLELFGVETTKRCERGARDGCVDSRIVLV